MCRIIYKLPFIEYPHILTVYICLNVPTFSANHYSKIFNLFILGFRNIFFHSQNLHLTETPNSMKWLLYVFSVKH